jgi:ABC-type Na+ transport system ATPase subunit NatA
VSAASGSFGILAYAKRRLRDLPTAARRVVPLVRACLARPRVVCAEAPLSDLDAVDAVIVAAALERVASDHALVLSFPARPADGPARALLERADFVFELDRGS